LRTGRDQGTVVAGEKVSVPPGASHTWYNHTDEPAVVRVEMDPGLTMARFLDEGTSWRERADSTARET
jgi:hypothetical protein